MKVCVLLFAIISLIFNRIVLQAQSNSIEIEPTKTFRLDPDMAKGASISEIFDEVKFIPLETTKESLFGRIDRIEFTSDYFVIFDGDTQAILIFKKNGRFHAKITSRNFDKKNEKPQMHFFTLDSDALVISVRCADHDYTFDIYGNRTDKKKVGVVDNKLKHLMSWPFRDGISLLYRYTDTIDQLTYDIALTKNNKVYWKGLPDSVGFYKTFSHIGITSILNDLRDSGLVYMRENDYAAYKIDFNGSIQIPFRFVFPTSYSIPKGFTDHTVYNAQERREYLSKHRKTILSIYNLYTMGDLVFFKCNAMPGGLTGKDLYLYNTRSANLFSLNSLEPDNLSSYLPVADYKQQPHPHVAAFSKFDGIYFYNNLSSIRMLNLWEENPRKSDIKDPIMIEYFRKYNSNSNPVIIRLKPKL